MTEDLKTIEDEEFEESCQGYYKWNYPEIADKSYCERTATSICPECGKIFCDLHVNMHDYNTGEIIE